MKTFTQLTEEIVAKKQLTTKKALADLLGTNTSTLSSALKSDQGSGYTGGLLDKASAIVAELDPPKPKVSTKGAKRAPAKGRLSRLRKYSDASWVAELNGDQLIISAVGSSHWEARSAKTDKLVAKAPTFKAIIHSLRELART